MASLQTTHAQLASSDRERGRVMLRTIKSEIQKHYYDPTFHGFDLEARFKEADELLRKATTNQKKRALSFPSSGSGSRLVTWPGRFHRRKR